jgi:hypothetical protein
MTSHYLNNDVVIMYDSGYDCVLFRELRGLAKIGYLLYGYPLSASLHNIPVDLYPLYGQVL